jgi:hypothetical protein
MRSITASVSSVTCSTANSFSRQNAKEKQEEILKLLEDVAGGEERWEENNLISFQDSITNKSNAIDSEEKSIKSEHNKSASKTPPSSVLKLTASSEPSEKIVNILRKVQVSHQTGIVSVPIKPTRPSRFSSPILRSNSERLPPRKMPGMKDNNTIKASIRSVSPTNRLGLTPSEQRTTTSSETLSLAFPRHPLLRKVSLSREGSEKSVNRINEVKKSTARYHDNKAQLTSERNRQYLDRRHTTSNKKLDPKLPQVDRRYTDSSVSSSYTCQPLLKTNCFLSTLTLPTANSSLHNSLQRIDKNSNRIDKMNNARLSRRRDTNFSSTERFSDENQIFGNSKRSSGMISFSNYKHLEKSKLHDYINAA